MHKCIWNVYRKQKKEKKEKDKDKYNKLFKLGSFTPVPHEARLARRVILNIRNEIFLEISKKKFPNDFLKH